MDTCACEGYPAAASIPCGVDPDTSSLFTLTIRRRMPSVDSLFTEVSEEEEAEVGGGEADPSCCGTVMAAAAAGVATPPLPALREDRCVDTGGKGCVRAGDGTGALRGGEHTRWMV